MNMNKELGERWKKSPLSILRYYHTSCLEELRKVLNLVPVAMLRSELGISRSSSMGAHHYTKQFL